MRRLSLLVAGALSLTLAMPAVSQSPFPSKPVQLLIGFPAGGGADLIARGMQGALAISLGQTVVIRNVTGAGGTIAGQQVVNGAPDGYLAILAPLGAGAVYLPHVRSIPYAHDALRPVCGLYDGPGTLMVAKDSPFRTVEDVLRIAREKPRTLFYGSPGPGSPAHVAMAGFTKAVGVEMTHVAYRGSADIAFAMRGGQIQFFADAFNIATQLDLRPLALFRSTALPIAPELPLMKDYGFPFEFSIHGGIFVAKDTPAPIVERWQTACREAVAAADTRAAFERMNVVSMYLDGNLYAQKLQRDHLAVGEIVRAAGIPRQD